MRFIHNSTRATWAAALLASATALVPAAAQGAAPTFDVATDAAPSSVVSSATGDFNADGNADLAIVGADGAVLVSYGTPTGTSTAGPRYATNNPHKRVTTGDLNGDGITDLVMLAANNSSSASTSLRVAYGSSAGLPIPIPPRITIAIELTEMATADLDGNGRSEVVLTGRYRSGEPNIDVVFIVDYTAGAYSYLGSSSPITTGPRPLVTGDFDRDGHADVATVTGDLIRVEYGNGQANQDRSTSLWNAFSNSIELPGATGATQLTSGDLDGDGFPELVARSEGQLTVWRSPSEHSARAGERSTIAVSGTGPVALADVDRDDKVDAITGDGDGNLVLHAGNGDGTFAPSHRLLASADPIQSITPADLNRDGRIDLAIGTSTGVSRLLNTTAVGPARGAFISEVRFSSPLGTRDQYVQIYNPGTTPLSLGGWHLRFASPESGTASRPVDFPEGTVVPPAGHVLVSTPPGKADSYSLADAGFTTFHLSDMAGGVALVDPSGTTRDAVGLVAQEGFYAGQPLVDFAAYGQGAFVRRYRNGVPVNTGNNHNDFLQLDTGADGTSTALLGAPRPDHLGSPTQKNAFLQSSLIDPAKTSSQSPNRVVTAATADTPATLTVNRTITNCSGTGKTGAECAKAATVDGVTVTKLRFRVTALSTVQQNVPAGTAILKAVASADASPGGIAVKGLPLDSPSPASGGGINATLTATALIPQGLAPGQSVNVAFTFEVQQAGNFTFAFNTEDDLIPADAPAPSTPAFGPAKPPLAITRVDLVSSEDSEPETSAPAQAPVATPAPQATPAPPGPVVAVPTGGTEAPAVGPATETVHGTIPASVVSPAPATSTAGATPLSGEARPAATTGKTTSAKPKTAACKTKTAKGTSKSRKAKKAKAKACATTSTKAKTAAKAKPNAKGKPVAKKTRAKSTAAKR